MDRNTVEKINISIVLVNWNNYDDTIECLNSLVQLDFPNYHVFIVDNASTDGSCELLKEDSKKLDLNITFIKSEKNLGFAGGNNLAITRSVEQGFQYIWLLNNDTIVMPNSLKELVNVIQKDNRIGIVGSKIYYNNSDLIWFAGGRLNTFTGSVNHIGIDKKDEGQFNESREVGYITGCSLLFRSDLIQSIGYMNEGFFIYYEETEWNIRAKKNEWKIYYAPKSIIYHKVSATSGGEGLSPYDAYYKIRNAYIMMKLTQPRVFRVCPFMFMLWKSTKKILKVILFNQNRKKERFWYVYLGVLHGLKSRTGKHPNFRHH